MTKKSQRAKRDGVSNTSKRKTGVTGNSEAETKQEAQSILDHGKKSSASTLPKRLITDPEILLAQMNDILLAMSNAGWFVAVQESDITGNPVIMSRLAPPSPHSVGVIGGIYSPVITLNGKKI